MYLEIVGKDHCDVVHVDPALLLYAILAAGSPARNGIQVRQGVNQNSGLRVEETDAALAVGSARAQYLELMEGFCKDQTMCQFVFTTLSVL